MTKKKPTGPQATHTWANESLQEGQRVFLAQIHRPILKLMFVFSLPIFWSVTLYWYYNTHSWQSTAMLTGAGIMTVLWIISYRLLQKERVELSASFFSLSILGESLLGMLLVDGLAISSLWAGVGAAMYSGLFSRRQLNFCVICLMTAMIAYVFVKMFNLYSMPTIEGTPRLFFIVGISAASGLIITIFLRKKQVINEMLLKTLNSTNASQTRVISAINSIEPRIGGAAKEIEQISMNLASQASEQAASTSEINATMNLMESSASNTAGIAHETRAMAQATREKSLANSNRMKSVEQGFNQVMGMISEAANDVTNLAFQMENIDEILGFNRQLGEYIKVLAVNASIEAASAGENGLAFGVVAGEFKSLILHTEQNLNRSRDLLQTIRDQSRLSSNNIIDGSKQIAQYFNELNITGKTVEENAGSFFETSNQVALIAEASRRQQSSITEMTATMHEINQAAVELSNLSNSLLENVENIVQIQTQLKHTLAQV